MSRKHNTKHNRSQSNYKKRLKADGLNKAPRMEDVETLRRRQGYVAPVDLAHTQHKILRMEGF